METIQKEISLKLNLQYFELKEGDGSLLVLFYRTKMLNWYVSNRRSLQVLANMGYEEAMSLEQKLQVLKTRFTELCPHEVGIFLGIPVEDVEGFIKHKGKACLMCRYWKVYSNPRRAQYMFNVYDTARNNVAIALVKQDKVCEQM
ncbi:hypothetical protein N752_28790 [Desulforamulus aquiferis]|nr:DUF3793 family protein [Desulforamulus aquiferis]RYD01575.1 hypothetical protein N752_28790 [Desulforamulus aquiferis]